MTRRDDLLALAERATDEGARLLGNALAMPDVRDADLSLPIARRLLSCAVSLRAIASEKDSE